MLTQLMPGFRNVRTPLITGYLWLLLIWLWLGKERLVPSPDSEGVPGRIADLAELLGHTTTLAALSVAVFLIGSLLVVPHWPLWHPPMYDRFRSYAELGTTSTVWWLVDIGDWVDERADVIGMQTPISFDELFNNQRLPSRFRGAIRQYLNGSDRTQVSKEDLVRSVTPDAVLHGAIGSLADELPMLKKRLRSAGGSFYDDFDRAQSESELRYSIATPLILLAVTCVTWTPWTLLGLALPAAILVQAYRSEKESVVHIYAAVRHRAIDSPTIEALNTFM